MSASEAARSVAMQETILTTTSAWRAARDVLDERRYRETLRITRLAIEREEHRLAAGDDLRALRQAA